jgi:amidohydrolase
VVNAVNAIQVNPTIPSSAKVTKLVAGGPALNAIPAKAELALDLRAQENAVMEELTNKVTRAITGGAATVGAEAVVVVKGGVPAAEYDTTIIELAREAICSVLGEAGLLDPIRTPGGEDFHFYARHKPSIKAGYIGLGCDLMPGLHHPEMHFNQAALADGVKILDFMVNRLLGFKHKSC